MPRRARVGFVPRVVDVRVRPPAWHPRGADMRARRGPAAMLDKWRRLPRVSASTAPKAYFGQVRNQPGPFDFSPLCFFPEVGSR